MIYHYLLCYSELSNYKTSVLLFHDLAVDFQNTRTHERTSSYPVGIECLHGSDHTILCWCFAVAALA